MPTASKKPGDTGVRIESTPRPRPGGSATGATLSMKHVPSAAGFMSDALARRTPGIDSSRAMSCG